MNVGDAVKITTGAFRGCKGVVGDVDRLGNPVYVISRGVWVYVDPDMWKPI